MLYPLFSCLRLPKLSYTREYSFELSGVEVRFSVPPMSSKWGSQRQFQDVFNLYNEDDYVRKDDPTPYIRCYITDWDVKGIPFFQEAKGTVPLYVSVSHWKGGGNLLRPRDMEAALTDINETEYADDQKCDKSVMTLLNWTPVIINGQEWLSYKTEEEAGSTTHQFLWVMPVSDQHFLMFSFPTRAYNLRPEVLEAMKNFCTQIMQSVHITFPDWVLRLKAEAQEKWPDEQYSQTKEPLRWLREDPPPMRFDEASYNARHGITEDSTEVETDDSDVEEKSKM
ncbi:hypothetical protein [Thalassolituus oleivorans]|uniref:hypothetical protein n=1 Tax=Thalassolituus oleivorans TaxID=187493 RepID=UPI0023EF5826|nr:hypothetical protein [Thalassolituus oleivorans]